MTQLSANLTFVADDPIQLQVKISTRANAELESVRKELGMTKVELLSRLCMAFADLPPVAQKLMLGLVDRELMGAAKDVLFRSLTTPPAEESKPLPSHPSSDGEGLEGLALDMIDDQAAKEAGQKKRRRAS